MSRILILAGLCFLILPFFLLGVPSSVEIELVGGEYGFVHDQGRVESRSASRSPLSGALLRNSGEPLSPSSNAHTAQRIAVQVPRAVSFQVLDSESEALIAGVHLRIFSVDGEEPRFFHKASFEKKGEIQLPLPEGSLEHWILDLEAPGYACTQENLGDLIDEEQEAAQVAYMQAGRTYVGRIFDPVGAPIPALEVLAEPITDHWSDPDGRFSIPVADDEDLEFVTLSAALPDVGGAELRVRLDDCPGLCFPDLRLQGAGVLRGSLKLADGSPLSGIRVVATRVPSEEEPKDGSPPGLRSADTRSDGAGQFVMRGVAPGQYQLTTALEDRGGRADLSHAWMTLQAPMKTGVPKLYRFHRLELRAEFPLRSQGRTVQVRLDLPDQLSADELVWKPRSESEILSLVLEAGTRLEITAGAENPETWIQHRAVVDRAQSRQRIVLAVPDENEWVPVTIRVQASEEIPSKILRVDLGNPRKNWNGGAWRRVDTTESEPGVFHFRMPPGLQPIRMRLEWRRTVMTCGVGRPKRKQRAERIPIDAWQTETRSVRAILGGSLQLQWRPRPQASMSYLFELEGHPRADILLEKIRISRLGSSASKKVPILDLDESATLGTGRTFCYGPELSPGLHRFRFAVEGYEPVVREVWLRAQEDRLLRILLRPKAPAPVPVMTEPYRCGRASR